MVPHIKVEETIQAVTEADPDELTFAVTGVPDPTRGERWSCCIPTCRTRSMKSAATWRPQGLPNIWIPSQDSFCQVDTIPVLGTGKLDLRGLKDLALERFGGEAAGRDRNFSYERICHRAHRGHREGIAWVARVTRLASFLSTNDAALSLLSVNSVPSVAKSFLPLYCPRTRIGTE